VRRSVFKVLIFRQISDDPVSAHYAFRDLSDIAVYLAVESGSDDLANRFLDAAEATFEHMAAMPSMGVLRLYHDPVLTDVRMWRIAGFDNYLIFYCPAETGIEIIRVLHAKRDIDSLFGGRS
jgi:toxin ParE1/3/4